MSHSDHLSEADWKHYHRLTPLLLRRYCERVLADAARVATDKTREDALERYQGLFRFLHERDEFLETGGIAHARSRAVVAIFDCRWRGLFTEEEYSKFTDDLRESVDEMIKARPAYADIPGPALTRRSTVIISSESVSAGNADIPKLAGRVRFQNAGPCGKDLPFSHYPQPHSFRIVAARASSRPCMATADYTTKSVASAFAPAFLDFRFTWNCTRLVCVRATSSSCVSSTANGRP